MPLLPLEGFVIGITADRRWEEQAELLRRRGASVLHGPSMSTLYLDCDETLRRATLDVIEGPPDYLVATTGIGIRAWFEAAQTWGLGDQLLAATAHSRVAARGPKAAGAAEAAGLTVWERAPSERLDDLRQLLVAQPLAGSRVAIQQHGDETPELTHALREAGAEVVEVPVYRWRLPDDPAPARRLIEAACEGRVSAVTFTSAPAVHNLFAIAAEDGVADDLRRAFNHEVVAACVGPVCAEGARQDGILAPLTPPVGRLGLLVRALSDRLQEHRRTFVLGLCEVSVQGTAVAVDGETVELAPRERAVFELLAERPGTVVSRAALLKRVWRSSDTDPHLLEVTVARLRRRLEPRGLAIRSRPGRGYCLDGQPPAPTAADS